MPAMPRSIKSKIEHTHPSSVPSPAVAAATVGLDFGVYLSDICVT